MGSTKGGDSAPVLTQGCSWVTVAIPQDKDGAEDGNDGGTLGVS